MDNVKETREWFHKHYKDVWRKKEKMKKKIVSVVLVLALTMSATGCRETARIVETAGSSESAGAEDLAEVSGTDADEDGNAVGEMTPWINSNVVQTVTDEFTADIRNDFYLAVNYDYLRDTTIKEGRTRESSFQELADVVNQRLIAMMKDDTLKGHDAELIRELYAMWLDWDTRNSLGTTMIMPHIEEIEKIGDLDGLTEYLCSEEGVFYGAAPSQMSVMQDVSEVQWYGVEILGSPLSLGDSDEYEKPTSVGERNLEAYREKSKLMFEKIGYDGKEAEAIIENAYAFEEAIAPAMMSTSEMYSPDAMERMINRVTIEELEKISPDYPIVGILKAMGLADSERINLAEPDWLAKLNELYTEEHFEIIKSYVLVQTLLSFDTFLDEELFREIIRIDNKVNGVAGSKTDEELALEDVKLLLQTSTSKVYAREYIGEDVREDVTNIIKECIDAYRTMLEEEDWLSDATKEKALEKLASLTINAAYPDKWTDTESLQITTKEDGGNYFTAVMEIRSHYLKQQRQRVNTKVDRELWADDMAITDVNAYYNPMDNSINIIGGIIGGIFYDPGMTEEQKLAGIGSVIGHEISHAFDTSGAQFDKDGNFADWWTEEDYAAFEERARKLIEYYNTIVPFDGGESYPGINVNGEAIADMAGVKCMMLMAADKENFDYDAFFRAYASMWKTVITREFCENLVYQNAHPMAYLRVNVTLMQIPEFYETYGIEEGDGMYMSEEDRIAVW